MCVLNHSRKRPITRLRAHLALCRSTATIFWRLNYSCSPYLKLRRYCVDLALLVHAHHYAPVDVLCSTAKMWWNITSEQQADWEHLAQDWSAWRHLGQIELLSMKFAQHEVSPLIKTGLPTKFPFVQLMFAYSENYKEIWLAALWNLALVQQAAEWVQDAWAQSQEELQARRHALLLVLELLPLPASTDKTAWRRRSIVSTISTILHLKALLFVGRAYIRTLSHSQNSWFFMDGLKSHVLVVTHREWLWETGLKPLWKR